MRKAIIPFLITFLFLTSFALAQVPLNPGEVPFEVSPIVTEPVPFESGDYCGNPLNPLTQNTKLALRGDLNFLNVRWNAVDPAGIPREIGVNCYFNCGAVSDIDSACAGTQSCTYRGLTGLHSCTIKDPKYLYTQYNRVVCRFFDQIAPTVDLAIESRNFRPSEYEISAVPSSIVTVGKETLFPINVRSFGLLQTAYTVNMTTAPGSPSLILKDNFAKTEQVICGEAGSIFPKLTFFSTLSVTFSILANSDSDKTICTPESDNGNFGPDPECSYLDTNPSNGICGNGVCWQKKSISINPGVSSLPDYNIFGFLILIFSATAIFFLRKKL